MSPRQEARDKARDMVRKFMALALDKGASDNEARNSAMHALKLIDEHDLLEAVVLPKGKRQTKAALETQMLALVARITFLEAELRMQRKVEALSGDERTELENLRRLNASLQGEVQRLNTQLLKRKK